MNKNKKREYKKDRIDPKTFKEYKVKEEIGLLDFLLKTLTNQSRNNVKSLLKNHMVAVDGAPITQFDFQLSKDDIVIVSKNRINKHSVSKKEVNIIYEDDEFIVIDKPSGLLSVASDKEKGKTAYRLVTDYLQAIDKHNRVYVVHRIDEDTSGVLMFAKNPKIRDILQDKWQEIVKARRYYAVVEGKMKFKEETLINYLKENKNNMMYVTDDKKNGKLCKTSYKVLKENDKYSLLDINIDSGRKNQIRVQLGHLGHFVLGDDKYGEPDNPISRLALHAYELEFVHPINKKTYRFKAKMPTSFLDLFSK